MRETWTLRGTIALSILVHAWAIHAAPQVAPSKLMAPEPVVVEFARQEPEPEIKEPDPPEETEPEPEPEPEAAPVPVPSPASEPEEALSEPDAAPDESESPPPELTGTTLIAEGDGPFSAEIGSGRARSGAIRSGGAGASQGKVGQAHPQVRAAPRPEEPKVIPLAQLSKKPAPPDLGPALERNFPLDARRQGKAGEAQVRARVEASGAVQVAQVFFESAGGFGDACKKTLLESKWTPPLDRAGAPVATWVSYRCKFRVD